jgi:eukaryotic-like serine/threonine-protein kinase
MSAEPPELLRYRVLARLGGGGLGELHLATGADQRTVVVKVARRDRSGAAACLEREAEALARLGPPWTPRLLDRTVTAAGDPALVVEHVEWPDLRRLLAERGVLSVGEALAIAGLLVDAVAAIHRAGVVHGDLAPANVLVRLSPPELRLIDVGATAGGDGALATMPYAAPELLEPRASADTRSDVYGLGVVLHELVAGELPFSGSPAEVRQAHRARRPPPVSRRPGVPAALDAPLARAMAKRPADRFADAAAMAAAWHAACEDARAHGADGSASGSTLITLAAGTAPSAAAPALTAAARRVVLVGFAGDLDGEDALDLVRAHGGAIALADGQRQVAAFWRGAAPADAGAVATGLRARGWRVEVEEVSLRVEAGPPPRFRGAALHRLATRLDNAAGVAASVRPEPPLVGRARDLDHLIESARAGLAAGEGAVVTVTAAPGLGKSRLAAELTAGLRAAGAPVVSVRAPDAGLGPPGAAALLALLGEAAAEPESRLADILASVDPVAAAALSCAAGVSAAPALAEPLRAAPGALRQAAARALADAIAARGAVCLLVDDAHRADPLLLDALELASMPGRAPIWVCLFARPSLLRTRPYLGGRAARRERIELEPLDDAAARALCRRLLDDVDAVPAAAIERLAARTGGVPLLIQELVGAVRRDRLRVRPRGGSYLETDRLTAPSDADITAWAAQGELDSLPEELARFARLVATVGGEVALDRLIAVIDELEAGGGRVTSWDPAAAAARLLAAGVLVERDRRLDFRHSLLREAVAAQVATADARAIHAAAARALAGAGQPVARARHASAAGLDGLAAAAWLEIAGAAAARHAYLDGEEALSRALDHLEPIDRRRPGALRGRGLARFRLGRHDDAMADFAVARAAAEADGDADLVVDLLLDEATALDWASDLAGANQKSDEALRRAGEGDPLRAARLAMADGRSRWRENRPDAAIAPLERAIALAAACGEDGYETWVAAKAMLGCLLPMVGELDRAETCLAEALAGAEARCDVLHRAAVMNNRCQLWSLRADGERLSADVAEATRIARELGMLGGEYRAELNEAVAALYIGHEGEAARHAARARSFEERMPDLFPVPGAAVMLAQIAARAGRRGEVIAWLSVLGSVAAPADVSAIGSGHVPGAVMPTIEWGLARWLADELEPAAWIEMAERAVADDAVESACEILDLLAIELGRRGRAADARELRARAAALPGVPPLLRARLEKTA